MNTLLRSSLATLLATAGVAAAVAAPASASAAGLPSITAVRFAGTAGPGVAPPTITVTGSGFGRAPAGVANNDTSCGTYSDNGSAYGSNLYFTDNTKFIAGYSDKTGAACIGVKVQSWSPTRIVLTFGNAYGSFTDWFLANGDGFALSVKHALYGGRVSRLT